MTTSTNPVGLNLAQNVQQGDQVTQAQQQSAQNIQTSQDSLTSANPPAEQRPTVLSRIKSVLKTILEGLSSMVSSIKVKIAYAISCISGSRGAVVNNGISTEGATIQSNNEQIPERAAVALQEEISQITEEIRTNDSHYAKLHALKNLINREQMANTVDNTCIDEAIKTSYRLLPQSLRSAIAYNVYANSDPHLEGNNAGEDHLLANPRSAFVKTAIEQIFNALPLTILTEKEEIIRNAQANTPVSTPEEKVQAFTDLLKLNLAPTFNNHSIAGPELNEERLHTSILIAYERLNTIPACNGLLLPQIENSFGGIAQALQRFQRVFQR